MAVKPRSVSSCSFTDGTGERERWTLTAAAGIGLDLGKELPMVGSWGELYAPSSRGLEKSKINALLP